MYHSLSLPANAFVVEMVPSAGDCTTGAEFFMALRLRIFQMHAMGHRDDHRGMTVQLELLQQVMERVDAYLLLTRADSKVRN